MRHSVIFTPEALEQLEALYRYVSAAASPEIAQRYTSAIVGVFYGGQDFETVLQSDLDDWDGKGDGGVQP